MKHNKRINKLLKKFIKKNKCNLIWMDMAENSSLNTDLEPLSQSSEWHEEAGPSRWWYDESYYSSFED